MEATEDEAVDWQARALAAEAKLEKHENGDVFGEMLSLIEQQRTDIERLHRQSGFGAATTASTTQLQRENRSLQVSLTQVLDELDDAKIRIQSLEGEIESHRQARIIEKAEGLKFLDDNTQLKRSVTETSRTFERDRAGYLAKIDRLEKQLERRGAAMSKAEHELRDLQSKYAVLEDSASQFESLSREPKDPFAHPDAARLRTDHDSLLHELNELEKRYAELETRHVDVQRSHDETSASLADINPRYDRLQSEFANMSKAYETALAVHVEFERTSDSNMKSLLKALEDARADATAKAQQMTQLEAQFASKSAEMDSHVTALASLRVEKAGRVERCKALEAALHRAESDAASSRTLLSALEAKNAALNAQLADTARHLAELRVSGAESLRGLQMRLDAADARVLEARESARATGAAALASAQARVASLESALNEQVRKYEEGVRKVFEATLLNGRDAPPGYQEEEVAHSKIRDLTDAVTSLTLQKHEQHVTFTNEVENMAAAHARELAAAEEKYSSLCDTLVREREHAGVQVASLSEEMKAVQLAHNLLVKDHGVLTASHAALQDKNERVVKDLEALQQTHSSLVREHNVLLTNSSSLEQQVKSRPDRTQDMEALKKEKATLEAEIKATQANLALVEETARQQLQDTYRAYTMEATRSYQMQGEIAQLNQQLRDLQLQLKRDNNRDTLAAENERLSNVLKQQQSEIQFLKTLVQQQPQGSSSPPASLSRNLLGTRKR
ncbi:hypothetical protein BC830DRAFT_1154771 [Chytriomyces sp. MP71]|nr:hypothetical protein BC830DRAFT_1154771 [Chytriomyces sp. MP71]